MPKKKGQRTNYCCAINCGNTREYCYRPDGTYVSFFRFPLRDKPRMDIWVRNTRREDFNFANMKQYILCEDHFEAKAFNCPDFKNSDQKIKTLLPSAIPTLFNIPYPAPKMTPSRRNFELAQIRASSSTQMDPGTTTDSVVEQQTADGDQQLTRENEVKQEQVQEDTNIHDDKDQLGDDDIRRDNSDLRLPVIIMSPLKNSTEDRNVESSETGIPNDRLTEQVQKADDPMNGVDDFENGCNNDDDHYKGDDDDDDDGDDDYDDDDDDDDEDYDDHDVDYYPAGRAQGQKIKKEPRDGDAAQPRKPRRRKRFRCGLCSKRFSRESDYVAHIQTHPASQSLFTCPWEGCGLPLASEQGMKIHYNKMHITPSLPASTKDDNTCMYCGKFFLAKYNLAIHIRSHTKDKPYLCTKCGERFTYNNTLANHMAHSHSDPDFPFRCEMCDQRYKEQSDYVQHAASHFTDNHEFACNKCNRTFKRKPHLREHYLSIHTDRDKREMLACDMCNSKFVSQRRLSIHKRVHDKKALHCEHCGRMFKSQRAKEIHEKEQCVTAPYRCPNCPRTFRYPQAYNNHVKKHTDKAAVCPCCSKHFPSASHLETHKRKSKRCTESITPESNTAVFLAKKLENEEKGCPYTCGVCYKGYKYQTAAVLHLRKHEGTGRILCPQCGESFNYRNALRKHLKTHTGTSWDVDQDCTTCPVCSKSFSSFSQLCRHTQRNKQCGSTFKSKQDSLFNIQARMYGYEGSNLSNQDQGITQTRGAIIQHHVDLGSGEQPWCGAIEMKIPPEEVSQPTFIKEEIMSDVSEDNDEEEMENKYDQSTDVENGEEKVDEDDKAKDIEDGAVSKLTFIKEEIMSDSSEATDIEDGIQENRVYGTVIKTDIGPVTIKVEVDSD